MYRPAIMAALLLSCCWLAACTSTSAEKPELPARQIKAEMETALTAGLLHRWYPASVDSLYGGFLSDFSYDWKPTGPHHKFIVTQARHLWTCSKAAEKYPHDARYAAAAAHGFGFLRDVMWDKEYGGFFNILSREGKLMMDHAYRDEKRAYGNAFGIYGLAAYYKLSHDEQALKLAQQAFHWLETHSHDAQYGGYFEFLTRRGENARTGYEAAPGSTAALAPKDQNSSIHLLEAFAELYQVWPDSLLEVRLREMLHLIRDTIVGDKPYMTLFFTPEWHPLSYRDSAPEVRQAHYHLDHVSFGHDVETAFLMYEADAVLGGEERAQSLQVGKRMPDHALANGYDHHTGGFYERGYYFAGADTISILDHRKNWWTQVEGFHSLLLFAKLFPEEAIYGEKFVHLWRYCQQYLMDAQHGGWYSYGLDESPQARTGPKGQIWKGNYHIARALMNSIQLLEAALHE
ncbi:MAG: N-acylglucosamine 2-epimerase [Bacteroidetes bacterium]|nr:MAG: N-acylglucosamine 2-epimerase [Bacteroidota bacterium]